MPGHGDKTVCWSDGANRSAGKRRYGGVGGGNEAFGQSRVLMVELLEGCTVAMVEEGERMERCSEARG